MNKKIKIAYCIPSLYYPSGMERVLTLKANFFTENLGYDIHIILTDGKEKQPYYKLHPLLLSINLILIMMKCTASRYIKGFGDIKENNDYLRNG